MEKLKAILGYLVAALSVPILLVTLMGMPTWMQLLVDTTGLHVSPWFTGDAVARTVAHGDYETRIHDAVFDALIGERREGFVQIDWYPYGLLPADFQEDIDYDGDGQADFHVAVVKATQAVTLTPLSPDVLGLQGVYRLDTALAIRVDLHNPRR